MTTGGEARRRLRDMEVIRAGYMDDVHRGIREECVETLVRLRDAEREGAFRASLGRAAQDTSNLDADPTQRLNMDRPDETGSDDGRPDLSQPHARCVSSTPLRGR
jgi:hypothetical protein